MAAGPAFFKNFIKTVVFLLFAFLGMFGFAMIGSLAYPVGGVGAIGGAIVGVLLCGCFGCLSTGLYSDLIPDEMTKHGPGYYLPGVLQEPLGIAGHGDFTVIVTVHEVTNLKVRGLLPWQPADIYCEVECGTNPTKTTCVRPDGKFNEQFRILVKAVDTAILFKIKDQDVFGCTDIGYVSVDVMKDVIEGGFPVRKKCKIEPWANAKIVYSRGNGDNDAKLVLTFDHTDSLPHGVGESYENNRKEWKTLVDGEWNTAGIKLGGGGGDYGTIGNKSAMEFNTTKTVEKVNGKDTTKLG